MQTNKKDQARLTHLLTQQGEKSGESRFSEGLNQVLTRRELDCFFLVARGLTGKAMAKQLNISVRTVETHLNHMRKKLRCYSKTQLAEIYWQLQSVKISAL